MAGPLAPSRSPWCARGDYDRCPHWLGARVRGLWRLRPRQELILCRDPYHSRCQLAGRQKASRKEWTASCTCLGAEASRQSFAHSEAKRRQLAAVFADVDLSDHPDAETIERRLGVAFQAHGEPLPNHLSGMARVVAAGAGRRGTRSAHMLGLGARSVAGGVRWAWQPGADANAKDRRALRGLLASTGALIGIAALLTIGAVRTSGWRRLPRAVGALLTWIFMARTVAIGALVATVVRMVRGVSPPPEP